MRGKGDGRQRPGDDESSDVSTSWVRSTDSPPISVIYARSLKVEHILKMSC